MIPKASKRIIRRLRARATKALRSTVDLADIPQGIGRTLDQTLDLVVPETPRKLMRITARRATRALRSKVELEDLQESLSRKLDQTWELMPLHSRLLVGHGTARDKVQNRQLAWSLAFVAGAVNAGGFLAVGAYTSHITGAVSRTADELVQGHKTLAFAALGLVACFALGAFCTGLLISLGRRLRLRSHYAISLMIEAVLLLVFGLMGSQLQQTQRFFLPMTVILLCFLMGMHNSIVTTISAAEVRTTHMTGIVTDIGLELSRLLYINVDAGRKFKRIVANRDKLLLHSLILVAFFLGGLTGAVGFKHVGFKLTIFLAAFLALLALRPILHDLKVRWRVSRQTSSEADEASSQ